VPCGDAWQVKPQARPWHPVLGWNESNLENVQSEMIAERTSHDKTTIKCL
jgi:hypothetical protein